MARTNGKEKTASAARVAKGPKAATSVTRSNSTKAKGNVKKLNTKKLEDRIAPGMVGSGLVDPGAMDTNEESSSQDSSTQNQALETNIESSGSYNTEAEADGGQYIDEQSNMDSPSYSDSSQDKYDPYQNESMNQDLSGFSSNYEGAAEPVDDANAWKEPDWVTANADGSVHVQPPAGVSVDQGIANFPLSVANEELPLPEEVTLQADGSADVALPEDASYNPETNILTMPGEEFNPNDVPKEFACYQNPDGDWNIQLPAEGVEYDSSSHSLNLSNEVINELAPNNIEINEDGSVSVGLPEGTTVNADGSWDMPAGAAEYMDNPPPAELTSLDFAEAQTDGSISFELPAQAQMEDGIVTFDHAMTDQLPIPDSMTINADGSMDIQVPEDCTFDADSGTLTLPAGEIKADDIPAGIDYTVSASGEYAITLPEGMSYAEGVVHCDNHWANEISPDSVYIDDNGAISVELPPGTEFEAQGQFTIPATQTDFLQVANPDYVHDSAFAEPQGDGSYAVIPPVGTDITDGQMNFSYEAALENIPMPDEVILNPDGTMDVKVPEGTVYNAVSNSLAFPADSVKLEEIPEGIDVSVSADGTIVALLPEGIEYSNGTCHFDNYWSNEFAPESVQINTDGSVNVTLPSDAEYQANGSVEIPAQSADFVQNPEPMYVAQGPEWIEANPDGSISFEAPKDISVMPEAGTMSLPVDMVMEQFDSQIPENFTLNADGSSDVKVPEGCVFNAEASLLVMPADSVNVNEVPSEVGAYVAPDGTICVPMQEGMSFNADSGSVHLDNYWTNELAPENVQIQANGSVEVALPSNTQYHEDGSFTIPASQADFITNPEPTYVADGPDWVSLEGNGSVTMAPPPGIEVNADAGTMSMSTSAVSEHFENEIPQDVTLNSDGTMDMSVPQGTTFDAAANSLTFPAGTVHMEEIPEGISASLNDQGQITVQLPEGIDYNNGVCHFDNYWTNELAPEPVQISSEGQVTVILPSETQYHQDGSLSVPAQSVDFMQNPEPAFVAQGPEWIESGATGGVEFHPPEDVQFNATTNTMSMSVDTLNEHFENQIPHDVTLYPDGTMEVQVPEGTAYNPVDNSLTFPADTVNVNEVPAGMESTLNPNGTLTVTLPEGIEYNNGVCYVDNYWTNQMAPPNVEISHDGMVQIQMPSDCYAHTDGSFSIPQGSTDFMNNPEPPYIAGGPDFAYSNPDGSIAFEPPPGSQFQLDPQAGTMTMNVDTMYEHFDNNIPQDITFNSDGTMDVKLPEGTEYANGVLTFSPDSVNINEIPKELAPYVNADSSISVALPEGMTYNADTASVHCDNNWTNTLTPDHMDVQPDGNIVVSLPPETQYYPQGMVIPADQAYFAAPVEYQNYVMPSSDSLSPTSPEGTTQSTYNTAA